MRVAWATDIHLDFLRPVAVTAFAEQIRDAAPDRVVLSGDLSTARALAGHLESLLTTLGRPIDFVLGNHDYYGASLADVRRQVAELCGRHPQLGYLPGAGVVPLEGGVALVGVDGWGDARFGAVETTPVRLNDFRLITDLQGHQGAALWACLGALGDAEAAQLAPTLEAALGAHQRVLVLTHVPPFREACWHEGRLSDDNWLPFFTCKATGEVLVAAAEAWPDRRILVLCGHTHGAGEAWPRPNLRVLTGGAEYRAPTFQLLDLAEGTTWEG